MASLSMGEPEIFVSYGTLLNLSTFLPVVRPKCFPVEISSLPNIFTANTPPSFIRSCEYLVFPIATVTSGGTHDVLITQASVMAFIFQHGRHLKAQRRFVKNPQPPASNFQIATFNFQLSTFISHPVDDYCTD